MIIELVYFNGCPNMDETRDNIKKACEATGQIVELKEWNRNDTSIPEHVKGYGSPTVLVNGEDIAGEKRDTLREANCRIYTGMTKVPSIELITEAIISHK